MKALTASVLLTISACASAQTTPADIGGDANTTEQEIQEAAAADDDAPQDPRIKDLQDRITLIDEQTKLLEAREKLLAAEKKVLDRKYPVATIANLKTGDNTGYEHTAFLANWALSANIDKLLPKIALPPDSSCNALLVSNDATLPGKLLAARAIKSTVSGLRTGSTTWLVDARKANAAAIAQGDAFKPESSVMGAFTMAQSLVTQSLDLLKYFRTDTEFKAITVKLSDQSLRSAVAAQCPGARLPDMAAPQNSALLDDYADLLLLGESIRLQLDKDAAKALPAALKVQGASLVASIDALKTELSTNNGGIPLLVTAAQLLSHTSATHVLTVQIMDQGGTVYKRSNLFFLSPKVSYIAAASVDYTLTSLETGAVAWRKSKQVRTQLNQRFAPWASPVKILDKQSNTPEADIQTTVID